MEKKLTLLKIGLLVFLNKEAYFPGDTVAIKLKGINPRQEIKCIFQEKEYPLFPLSKDSARILIGLPANQKPGEYE